MSSIIRKVKPTEYTVLTKLFTWLCDNLFLCVENSNKINKKFINLVKLIRRGGKKKYRHWEIWNRESDVTPRCSQAISKVQLKRPSYRFHERVTLSGVRSPDRAPVDRSNRALVNDLVSRNGHHRTFIKGKGTLESSANANGKTRRRISANRHRQISAIILETNMRQEARESPLFTRRQVDRQLRHRALRQVK